MDLTLEEIDEALAHSRAVPESDRGEAWYAWVDGLLEMRSDVTRQATTPTFSS